MCCFIIMLTNQTLQVGQDGKPDPGAVRNIRRPRYVKEMKEEASGEFSEIQHQCNIRITHVSRVFQDIHKVSNVTKNSTAARMATNAVPCSDLHEAVVLGGMPWITTLTQRHGDTICHTVMVTKMAATKQRKGPITCLTLTCKPRRNWKTRWTRHS